jgi:putative copper resistance protein D
MATGDLIFAVTRALHIGCALLLVSFPLFAMFVWRPTPSDRGRYETFCQNVVVLLGGLLMVEVLTGAAWLWYVVESMVDEPSPWPSVADIGLVLTGTRFGMLWMVRTGIAVMLGSVLASLAVGRTMPRGWFQVAMGLALALGAALLGSLALSGHAASGLRWTAWHLFVDMVHLLAGAVWPLGLVPLAIFLVRSRPRGSPLGGTDIVVVQRYSGCAFAAVFALLASGVANSWLMLPSWHALVASTYGQLLMAKVLLVLAMLALGALNRYRFLPALARGAAPAMARTVAIESGLAVVVLLVVGLMGTTAPGP